MSRFLEDATRIFEVAESAGEAGHTPSDVTIVIGPEHGIRMICDSDWPLERLRAHHGGGVVYRVGRRGDVIRLEGRSQERTCVLESQTPARAGRPAPALTYYTVVNESSTGDRHPGGSWLTLPAASD